MTLKLFIDSDNTVVLSCPRCSRSRKVDVSRYIDRDREIRIQARCSCGHTYPVYLERRRQYRKATLLRGTFTFNPPPDRTCAACKGAMTVVDISRGGLRLRINPMPDFRAGDRIQVEFTLNDVQQTLVHREVTVQNIAPPFVGTKFLRPHHLDAAIGFYLFR